MNKNIEKILKENDKRIDKINTPFNPITGLGSVGKRIAVSFSDWGLGTWYLPVAMHKIPFIKLLTTYNSVADFITDELSEKATQKNIEIVVEKLVRMRFRYDFPFWAAYLVWIKNKGGGEDVHFRLTRPQRKMVDMLEQLRNSNQPIRLILLKARQWGGSTTIQLYMAWLQMVHKVGLNSLIIAHVSHTSNEIQDMFQRMLNRYPVKFLYKLGEMHDESEKKWKGVGNSGVIHSVPQRNCKIKVGTAENPDACRGGDYNLVHLSEVGLFPNTEKHTPEMIVRSACSGVLYKPYTMIVYESTADGTGSFFHTEWIAATKGESQYKPLFISWFDIDQYSLDFGSVKEKEAFAAWLWDNRENGNVSSDREEPGKYYWYLWECGATLEALLWYKHERSGKNSHQVMAAEFPSNDVEAFTHAGKRVFDMYQVEKLRKTCRPPKWVGDVYGKTNSGKDALKDIRFSEDRQGQLWVWYQPEIDNDTQVKNRYLVVVDIGGRSNKADWSVILVIDRLNMIDLGQPTVVAQWYGHIDIDLLAWKAAMIAAYYDNALLVIESNTLETHDKNRDVDGDQSEFILNQLKDVYHNLYARKPSEDAVRQGVETRYGFHTNVSTKPKIITMLQMAIREKLYVERDERCINEYLTYEKEPNGAFNAIKGKHDDLLMTRAIGLWVCFREMEPPLIVDKVKQQKAAAQRKRKAMAISAATI